MRARNKNLSAWLNDIERGVLRLPRFQRNEVWTPKHIRNFFDAIFKKRPLGVLLVLPVYGEKRPFPTRPIAGLSQLKEPCRVQLLDGQQRLTVITRALRDNFKNQTYYVVFKAHGKRLITCATTSSAKTRSWYGNPKKEYAKRYVPMSILAPGEAGFRQANEWRESVLRDVPMTRGEQRALRAYINSLRKHIRDTTLPYFSIPHGTSGAEAIDIFHDINTSAVKLTTFEIANALYEKETSRSLHKYVNEVKKRTPTLANLEGNKNFGNLILKMAYINQGLAPKDTSYRDLDFNDFHSEKDHFLNGLIWLENFLIDEGLWDSKWLPSTVPFRVLPVLHPIFGNFKRQSKANCTKLLRSYLWRAFLTERYFTQANDKLKRDYELIKEKLENRDFGLTSDGSDTIFDDSKYTLPPLSKLKEQGWPGKKGILKNAILAIGVKKGAYGLETDEEYGPRSDNRDHHHIFPVNIFEDEDACSKVLNCMMLEREANSSWSDRWPGDFLGDLIRALRVETGPSARASIVKKLRSHTLPAEQLISATDDGKKDIGAVFEGFISARAELVLAAMKVLFDGGEYK